jgi:hypothetical protein
VAVETRVTRRQEVAVAVLLPNRRRRSLVVATQMVVRTVAVTNQMVAQPYSRPCRERRHDIFFASPRGLFGLPDAHIAFDGPSEPRYIFEAQSTAVPRAIKAPLSDASFAYFELTRILPSLLQDPHAIPTHKCRFGAICVFGRATMPRKGRLLRADTSRRMAIFSCPGIHPRGFPDATWRLMLAANLPLPKRQPVAVGKKWRAGQQLCSALHTAGSENPLL